MDGKSQPNSCDLWAALVLEKNEAQNFTAEHVYWDLVSLLHCELG